MPLDDDPKPPTLTGDPTREEIEAQREKLCLHEDFQGDKLVHLLRFLVDEKLKILLPEESNPRRAIKTGKTRVFDFYNYLNRLTGEKPPRDEDETELQGKKLVNLLGAKLEEYYDSAPDRVVILIKPGRNTGYLPTIAYRGDPRLGRARRKVLTAASLIHGQSQVIGSPVDCTYMGNDLEAVKYLRQCFLRIGPKKLVYFRDTHFRTLPKVIPISYSELVSPFRSFLKATPPRTRVGTILMGRYPDQTYIDLLFWMTGYPEKVKILRRKHGGFLMNFILLDFDDSTTEVLFGWGHSRPGWAGAVFKSHDQRLVASYHNLYEVLSQDCEEYTDVNSLIAYNSDVPMISVPD